MRYLVDITRGQRPCTLGLAHRNWYLVVFAFRDLYTRTDEYLNGFLIGIHLEVRRHRKIDLHFFEYHTL